LLGRIQPWGATMENSIEDWTRFAKHVENQLVGMDGCFSDSYLGSIKLLIKKLRDKVTLIDQLGLDEKLICFLQINKIGSELKTTAHFAKLESI